MALLDNLSKSFWDSIKQARAAKKSLAESEEVGAERPEAEKPVDKAVSSSNVARIGRDPVAHNLNVTFKGGKGGAKYLYENVPDDVWKAFSAGPSYGKNVWSMLRDRSQKGSPSKYNGHRIA
jgi:hypothetical protein